MPDEDEDEKEENEKDKTDEKEKEKQPGSTTKSAAKKKTQEPPQPTTNDVARKNMAEEIAATFAVMREFSGVDIDVIRDVVEQNNGRLPDIQKSLHALLK